MITCIVGDSNFRELYSAYKDDFAKTLKSPVKFEYATSVVSVGTVLESPNLKSDIVFIASPTNEISQRSRNNTKSREGIIESVLTEFFDIIGQAASKMSATLFVVCYPPLRLEPPWIEGKMEFYGETLRKTLNNTNASNVHLGSEISITQNDLKADRVHLNKEGLKKLYENIVGDMKTAFAEVTVLRTGEGQDDMEEDSPSSSSESTPTASASQRSLRKTPARNKRHFEEPEDAGKGAKKRRSNGAKIESVLDKLDLFMRELREDRNKNTERFDHVESKIEAVVVGQEALKKEMKNIKEADNSFSASVREDLDAIENLNSRDTVIIKKLKIDRVCPTEKTELSALILETGKEVLTLIMGDTTSMKYISPLFQRNERRIPKEGERNELPPFKITFRLVSDAIIFKEKAIAASKDPSHRLYKAYFAHQQNVGTRIRLMLLWSIADYLKKKENKDSWVSQSSPKPTLMVKHVGTQVKTYSYIDAVTSYGEKIEGKVLDEAHKLARKFYYGQVEKVFLVLKD
jgi:hypothetical protein